MERSMEMNKQIPIIIPAYEPDEKLILLLDELKNFGMTEIIVVDDGSEGEKYQELFCKIPQCHGLPF